MDNHTYLMRSLMFVPAHNQKLLDSSLRRNADVLLLDIEDSVPVTEKQHARDNIKAFAAQNGGGRLLFPRVNDRESGELLKDLYQLTIPGITGFMYPKSTKEEDVYFVGKLLETIEYEKNIPIGTFKLIPLIETAGAIVNIKDICTACTRVVAVAFGCEDYVTDLRGKHDAEGQSIFHARNAIVNAARATGVLPIDTVHIKVHDLEDLERNLILSKDLGFEGMLVLNPKELPLVNNYFTPSEKEVAWATEMVRLSEEAVKEGKGVAVKDGKFIGPPMLKMANSILNKYRMINERKQINENKQNMTKKLVIIGGEGNGGVIASAIADNRKRFNDNEWEVVGFVNDFDQEVDGYPVIGKMADIQTLIETTDYYFSWAIHLVGRNYKTAEMFQEANIPAERLATVIHKTAFIGERVTIEPGAFIMANSYVGPETHVGTCSLIMANCSIGHNVKIGPLCHCSVSTVMTGYSELGFCADMAVASTILAYKKVGNYAMAGAASLVTHDIPDGEIWVGTPAKLLKEMPKEQMGGGKFLILNYALQVLCAA